MFLGPPPLVLASTAVGITTWNPAAKDAGVTLSNSNRTASGNSAGVHGITSKSSGDWTVEFTLTTMPSPLELVVGLAATTTSRNVFGAGQFGYRCGDGVYFVNGSPSGSAASASVGDRIQFRLVNGTHVYVYKNGVVLTSNSVWNPGVAIVPWCCFFSASGVVTLSNVQAIPSGSALWV